MFKRILTTIMIALLAVLMVGCGNGAKPKAAAEHKPASGTLEVKVLNVGQGDAILIRTGKQTVLVDTSDIDERDNLLRELKKAGVRVIDKLIITHPHADHLGGAALVFKEFDVREIYDNGLAAKPKFYLDYLKMIKRKNIPYKELRAGDTLDFGNGVKFDVLSPTADFINHGAKNAKGNIDINGSSIVGRLTFGNFAMMLTGDIEMHGEKEILKNHSGDLKCQVLKVAHHGSKSSSSEQFLKKVSPKVGIISCGTGNDYGHPHEKAMMRLNQRKMKLYRTDVNGTITVTTDGTNFDVKGEK